MIIHPVQHHQIREFSQPYFHLLTSIAMSWRDTRGSTGANNIPLGNRRRFGGEDGTPEGLSPQPELKRGRSPGSYSQPEPRCNRYSHYSDRTERRKKRNRWGNVDENKAAGLMGLPTAIQAPMTAEQLDAYVLHLRIEEISQKLRINDVVPGDADRYVATSSCFLIAANNNRSPSPPPQYDNLGRRTNTREQRYKRKLEDERHKLVEKALKNIPDYHPPSDYRRPAKTQEKVYVPVNDYPEINFSKILTLTSKPVCSANIVELFLSYIARLIGICASAHQRMYFTYLDITFP
jgi:splicing factor 1